MPNGIDGVVAYYALAKAGLVRVPLNARDTAHEHAYKIDDSQARGLVYVGDAPAERRVRTDHRRRAAGPDRGVGPRARATSVATRTRRLPPRLHRRHHRQAQGAWC